MEKGEEPSIQAILSVIFTACPLSVKRKLVDGLYVQ